MFFFSLLGLIEISPQYQHKRNSRRLLTQTTELGFSTRRTMPTKLEPRRRQWSLSTRQADRVRPAARAMHFLAHSDGNHKCRWCEAERSSPCLGIARGIRERDGSRLRPWDRFPTETNYLVLREFQSKEASYCKQVQSSVSLSLAFRCLLFSVERRRTDTRTVYYRRVYHGAWRRREVSSAHSLRDTRLKSLQ